LVFFFFLVFSFGCLVPFHLFFLFPPFFFRAMDAAPNSSQLIYPFLLARAVPLTNRGFRISLCFSRAPGLSSFSHPLFFLSFPHTPKHKSYPIPLSTTVARRESPPWMAVLHHLHSLSARITLLVYGDANPFPRLPPSLPQIDKLHASCVSFLFLERGGVSVSLSCPALKLH